MLNAAVEVNEGQPERLLTLMDQHVNVTGEYVAVLGFALSQVQTILETLVRFQSSRVFRSGTPR